MSRVRLQRRRFLALGAAGAGSLLLSGCDRLSSAPDFQEFFSSAEWLTYRVQRLLGGSHALAREFGPTDMNFPLDTHTIALGTGFARQRIAAQERGRIGRWPCAADPVTIANAHLLVGQAVDGEVLPELPIREIVSTELALPIVIGANAMLSVSQKAGPPLCVRL